MIGHIIDKQTSCLLKHCPLHRLKKSQTYIYTTIHTHTQIVVAAYQLQSLSLGTLPYSMHLENITTTQNLDL